jgi:twitching motility protein PilJ
MTLKLLEQLKGELGRVNFLAAARETRFDLGGVFEVLLCLRILLVVIQLAVVLLVAGVTLPSLEDATRVAEHQQKDIGLLADTTGAIRLVWDKLYANTLVASELGTLTWAEARDRFDKVMSEYDQTQEALSGVGETAEASQALEELKGHFSVLEDLLEAEDAPILRLYMLNEFFPTMVEFTETFSKLTALQTQAAEAAFLQQKTDSQSSQQWVALLIGVGLLLGTLFGSAIYLSIARPTRRLLETVQQVTEGNLEARTDLNRRDELGTLGKALDIMIAEKVTAAATEQENIQLNNSIIELLKVTAQLGERDLRVQATVTPDVTGPLADAINRVVEEIGRVLVEVKQTADRVAASCQSVDTQSDAVLKLAANERTQVTRMSQGLEQASQAMATVATLAQQCNENAGQSREQTQSARDTVGRTVEGMNKIRETIRETEKRFKRLAERSQEIRGIVDLISNIAERTRVLGLNASMQAAVAGEAGRGFAVVADEVQRLAENAHQSTTQIAKLVQNIQAETNDTIITMNNAISQVVEESHLAEQAGQQMQATQQTTDTLADSVEHIASQAQEQAQTSLQLRERANHVRLTTQQTALALSKQRKQTMRLVEYAAALVNSVSEFLLPERPAMEAEVELPPSAAAPFLDTSVTAASAEEAVKPAEDALRPALQQAVG